jgi:RNA polymerase sigma factor (sigma-70 family)
LAVMSTQSTLHRIETTRAAMAGDPAATLRLLNLTQPEIRRFARRQCQHSSDIDDAVQEALWLLYRRVGTLRLADNLMSWLFVVVRNSCMKLARSVFSKQVELDELIDKENYSTRPPHELRIDLANAIGSLPPHYRQIILLRDFQEMTINEIASELLLTREATKARLFRARALIREYLSK